MSDRPVLKKYLPIILIIFAINTVCCLVISFSSAFASDSTNNTIQTLFFAAGCIGLPLLAFGGMAWSLWNIRQSRRVAGKLAEALRLRPLNPGARQLAAWYGGEHRGYVYAIKPAATVSSSFDGERTRRSVRFWLRIVLVLPMPLDGARIVRGVTQTSGYATFEEAFSRREGEMLLTEPARAAMLTFVQLGYPTGLQSTVLRTRRGARNLRLYDRALCPDDVIPADVLAGAPTVLLHDYPDAPAVTPERLHALLNDLVTVAHAIEGSH